MEREEIQRIGMGTRGATAESFKEFIKAFDKQVEIDSDEHHKANMAMMNAKI